jgi:hypothetical protein
MVCDQCGSRLFSRAAVVVEGSFTAIVLAFFRRCSNHKIAYLRHNWKNHSIQQKLTRWRTIGMMIEGFVLAFYCFRRIIQ